MCRCIIFCMLAALICGNQTQSEDGDDIIRLTQLNSKHVFVQKDKTVTRRKHTTTEKQIKIVAHINATDNKRLDALHRLSKVKNPHKVNERRFGNIHKSSNVDKNIKFKRTEIKSTEATTTTATNTVQAKRAEIIPDDKKEDSGIESIEESESEFHTANRLFLLEMEKEEEQSDIFPMDAMEGRKFNQNFKIEAAGGLSPSYKANNKQNKSDVPNSTKLVQIKQQHIHDQHLKPRIELKLTTKDVPQIRKENSSRKNSKKSNETSPAATYKRDKKPRTELTPIIKQSSFEKAKTVETRNGSTKIDNVSVSDDDISKDKEKTNKKTDKTETRSSGAEIGDKPISAEGDDLSEKDDVETNKTTEKAETRNGTVKINDERISDEISDSTEIMTRARSSRSCSSKRTRKLCIKSCHNAFVDACKRLECARNPKLELRKQCKKSCKAIFRY